MNERELAREQALAKHKKRRAATIARIRRKKRIDNYIKSRVYIILGISFLLIFLFILDKRETNKQIAEHIETYDESIDFMTGMVEKFSHDNLIDINRQLARACDSLGIIIVVYHRRFMRDQKTIHHISSKVPFSVRKTLSKHNNLTIPDYMEDDDSLYEYGIDSLYEFEDSVEFYEADTLDYLN